MSDVRQGDDWWMASDGKWYPPTSIPEPPAPPSPPPSAPPPSGPAPPAKSKPGCLFGPLAALLLIGGCVGYAVVAGDNDQRGDASARLACSEFRSTARAESDGLLTQSELRDRIKKIYDRGWVSETAGIAPAATDMLAAVTAFDDAALADAVTRMGNACRAIGG